MTSSTSAVAVCCSSDSTDRRCAAQLVEQPRVLDGDDRLGGKVLHQLDLLIGEGTNFFCGPGVTAPISSLSLSIGTARNVRARPISTAATIPGSRCSV